ncbi:DNA methylase [Streptomyces sp. NPDC101117]|uniref:DNA methylase n=1 Tax=Streptomyces sp. NPDC101117 TaxID=3366108 RepID=UPI003813C8D4
MTQRRAFGEGRLAHATERSRGRTRPRLLDLFSCAGGAAVGYHRAGFAVDGCDIVDRPNYPFAYHHGDALTYLAALIASGEIERYAFVHASPPCQHGCALTVGTNTSRGWGRAHVDLVAPVRDLLDETGLPYVIEQPNGRAEIRKDLTLCGEMFGLGVIRHRNFEVGGWSIEKPAHVPHRGRVRGWRHGRFYDGPYVAAYGNGGGKPTIPELQQAMGMTWTDVREELTEAIPPAYTEAIGRAYLADHSALEVVA